MAATRKSCSVNGHAKLDGAKWDDDCNTCHCHNGKVVCTKVGHGCAQSNTAYKQTMQRTQRVVVSAPGWEGHVGPPQHLQRVDLGVSNSKELKKKKTHVRTHTHIMPLWGREKIKKAQHASSPSSRERLGEDWVTQCGGLGKVPSRPCLSRSRDDIDALLAARAAAGRAARRSSAAESDPRPSGADQLDGGGNVMHDGQFCLVI